MSDHILRDNGAIYNSVRPVYSLYRLTLKRDNNIKDYWYIFIIIL
jgi:hypothetical protein